MVESQYMINEQYSGAPVSKLPILLIITIIALCLIGGGTFAYYRLTTPTLSSNEILKNSLEASKDVRSLSFTAVSNGKIESNIGNGIPSASNFTFNSKGSIDFHSIDKLLFDLSIGINASVNTATSSGSLLSDLNAIYINKNLYLDLKNFSVSYTSTDPKAMGTQMFVGMANNFASSLRNKWIKIDTSKSIKKSSESGTFTNEDILMIRDYVLGMSYITSIDKVGEETINDTSTYHLKATIQNGQELIDLIKKINKDSKISDERMSDISKAINQKIDLDIWVGKRDYLIYKVVSSSVMISDTQTGTKTVTSQELVFDNYNKPVSVVAPQGAVSLEQIMSNLFKGLK